MRDEERGGGGGSGGSGGGSGGSGGSAAMARGNAECEFNSKASRHVPSSMAAWASYWARWTARAGAYPSLVEPEAQAGKTMKVKAANLRRT